MNKGFTLVELIAVIVILALIMIITTPAYDSISGNINDRNYESKKSTIKAQTLSYVEKYLKNDVYDYKDINSDGKNDYTLYLNIKNNIIDETGTSTKMNISKALCFTPDYLIRNGIISSEDEKEEYIKNDKTGNRYSGSGEDNIYIKVYYNIEKLKLNTIVIEETNTITYNNNDMVEVSFNDIECSKIDNK